MSGNILNKPAMEHIADLSHQIPYIREHLAEIVNNQKEMADKVNKIPVIETKIEGLERAVVDIPNRCPYREAIAKSEDTANEVKALKATTNDMGKDIASLKTTDKLIGGANAVFTVVINGLETFFRSLIP